MTTAPLSLEHLVRPSTQTEGKARVAFLLHGYGSNEEDLFSFAGELPEELCVIAVRAPYSIQPFGYAWYAINFDAAYGKWTDIPQAKESIKKILHFLEEACRVYNLDRETVTLLGFSQGAVLSYALALSHPEGINRVIALSGYIDEKLLLPGYESKDHSSLEIYASHGQMDMVIPPEWAQKAPELLEKLEIAHTYQEFPVGHGVSPANFASLLDWLESRL